VSKEASKVGAGELRDVIEHALKEVDIDERRGALLRATGMKVRFEITDLNLVLRVRAAEDSAHHLSWAFAGDDEDDGLAGLSLQMDSATANAYLQGRASLPVAIARGQVRCSGDLSRALVDLPALQLLVEPYRSWVARLHPHLAVA
jgi:hypothetical protein